MTFFRNFYSNGSFHSIVYHASFFSCRDNFFNSISMSTNFSVVECDFCESYSSIGFVSYSLNFFTIRIFKHEVKFAIFKLTSSQFLSEVKFNFNRSYNIVVEDLIISTCAKSTFSTVFNSCLQFTFRILSYSNCHGNSHCVVVNVCIRTLLFSDLVFISTSFVKSKLAECRFAVLVCNSFFVFIRTALLFC